MHDAQVIDFTAKCLLLVFYLSLPTIIAASLVGTLVSLFQALTQVQEQTLSFAVKLFAVVVTIFLTARWQGGELFNYALDIFNHIPALAR